jgi:hypothetical protein
MKKLATAVERSETSKLGLTHATYASQRSCPSDCAFMGNGCYAEGGPTGIHTRRLNNAAVHATPLEVAEAEAAAIDTLSGTLDLRIHVVGDCTTSKAADLVSSAALRRIRRSRRIWSYTHAWRDVEREAWQDVSVLASCERPEQAIEALDKGWAAAVVLPIFKDERLHVQGGLKVLPCPHQTRGVKCVDCGLCMNAERLHGKGIAVGFVPHGARKKRVLTVITQS